MSLIELLQNKTYIESCVNDQFSLFHIDLQKFVLTLRGQRLSVVNCPQDRFVICGCDVIDNAADPLF